MRHRFLILVVFVSCLFMGCRQKPPTKGATSKDTIDSSPKKMVSKSKAISSGKVPTQTKKKALAPEEFNPPFAARENPFNLKIPRKQVQKAVKRIDVSLKGIIGSKQPRALLTFEGKTHLIGKGERIGTILVIDVTSSEVVLQQGDQKQVLSFYNSKKSIVVSD